MIISIALGIVLGYIVLSVLVFVLSEICSYTPPISEEVMAARRAQWEREYQEMLKRRTY